MRLAQLQMSEFSLYIPERKPNQFPAARLAKYLLHFAELVGDGVVYDAIETGSTAIRYRVADELQTETAARLALIGDGEAPSGLRKAAEVLEKMLDEDQLTAKLLHGSNVVYLFSPRDKEARIGPIKQRMTLNGQLSQFGGKDATKHGILLLTGGGQASFSIGEEYCMAVRELLFEHVRVSGIANMYREASGVWRMTRFNADSVERAPVDADLDTFLADLRSAAALAGPMPDAYERVMREREDID